MNLSFSFLEHDIFILSVTFFFLSLIASIFFLKKMPSTYWLDTDKRGDSGTLLKLLRNSIAIPIMIVGVVLLLLPGQGIITIIFGICISDFRFKQTILRKVLQKKKTQRSLNFLRDKLGEPRFIFPKALR